MRGAQVFTTLDFNKSYYQMQLDENFKKITAFTTPKRLSSKKVLLVGKTSRAVFQQLKDDILGNLQPKCAVVYIGCITVFSLTMEQHLKDVAKFFECLNRVNIKVNVDKCKFVQNEVKVLGFLVLARSIKPDANKIITIQTLLIPTDITKVKSFLDIINFYKKYILNCAKIAKPLVRLTQGHKDKKQFFGLTNSN